MKILFRIRSEFKLILAWLASLLFVIVYFSLKYEYLKQHLSHANESIPLIFIGGVPRSGTTLMRAMLDAHPAVRCGEETRILPNIISFKMDSKKAREKQKLDNAGVTEDVIDAAVRAFMLNVIVKHGDSAEHLCNKDPLLFTHLTYLKSLFPMSKYILMIRDGRAVVHSIITRKITVSGFNLQSYRESLVKWNMLIEAMYAQCFEVGSDVCLPVYYEQLVLSPEKVSKVIFNFLGIEWNEAVIHHEKFIGSEVSISDTERSTDQIIKPINVDALSTWVGIIPNDVVNDMASVAPMLARLGYDPLANPPKYDSPDFKFKPSINGF
jgi:protein-tyrosine sulfotransferase